MVSSKHFRHLESLYASSSEERDTSRPAVSLGRAIIQATIEQNAPSPQELANHTHYRELLSDAGALAAGSLVEDRLVASEQFNLRVEEAGYSGPVTVSARVVLAQPPRYHVEVQLLDVYGDVLAVGTGVFTPSSVELPDAGDAGASTPTDNKRPEPAVYASVWATPFGMVHLN